MRMPVKYEEITCKRVLDSFGIIDTRFWTRQILEVLKENNCPFAIGTKSDLVLRDLDLISEASKKVHCCVSLSITTLDENLAKRLEPNAPPPKRRLEVI